MKINLLLQLEPNKSFNPYFSGSCSAMPKIPSFRKTSWSFNPYFSGSCSAIETREVCYLQAHARFNPYFSGSCSAIANAAFLMDWYIEVSILILVEAVLQLSVKDSIARIKSVSILILVEAVLQFIRFDR